MAAPEERRARGSSEKFQLANAATGTDKSVWREANSGEKTQGRTTRKPDKKKKLKKKRSHLRYQVQFVFTQRLHFFSFFFLALQASVNEQINCCRSGNHARPFGDLPYVLEDYNLLYWLQRLEVQETFFSTL